MIERLKLPGGLPVYIDPHLDDDRILVGRTSDATQKTCSLEEDLVGKIMQAAQRINQQQLKGSANYVIVSPKLAKAIEEGYLAERVRKERRQKLDRIFQA